VRIALTIYTSEWNCEQTSRDFSCLANEILQRFYMCISNLIAVSLLLLYLGLDKIHQLTVGKGCRLRIDFWSFEDEYVYAHYR